MAQYRDEWGEAVREAIGDRTFASIAKAAGISQGYLSNFLQGRVPKPDKVLAIAQATGGDPSGLLLAAGYAPLPGAVREEQETYVVPAWDADRELVRGLRRIKAKVGKTFHLSVDDLELADASREGVEERLKTIKRRLVEAGYAPAAVLCRHVAASPGTAST